MALLARIAAAKAQLTSIRCPQTIALAAIEGTEVARAVEMTEWIPAATDLPGDLVELGTTIGHLHQELQAAGGDFHDRPLSLTSVTTSARTQPWELAIARAPEAINAWDALHDDPLAQQTIHGDLHPGNLLRVSTGYAVLDFDKMMCGPRTYDLAKLITTTCFIIPAPGSEARFAHADAQQILAGYRRVSPLSSAESAAIPGACLYVNRATGELGLQHDDHLTIKRAVAIAEWLIHHQPEELLR